MHRLLYHLIRSVQIIIQSDQIIFVLLKHLIGEEAPFWTLEHGTFVLLHFNTGGILAHRQLSPRQHL